MALRQQRFCVYFTFIFAALSVTSISLAQQNAPVRGRLSLPDKSWGVTLELPGFAVRTVETKPDGRRYMFAQKRSCRYGSFAHTRADQAGSSRRGVSRITSAKDEESSCKGRRREVFSLGRIRRDAVHGSRIQRSEDQPEECLRL